MLSTLAAQSWIANPIRRTPSITATAISEYFDAGEVTATVEDDGRGFEMPDGPDADARAGHFGLMGMQERAQLFGGHVYVKSARNAGTKVVAFLPLQPWPADGTPAAAP